MCFYNINMEVVCVSTICIWKLYVFLLFTCRSCMCFYYLHIDVLCFYNSHMEVVCVSSINM